VRHCEMAGREARCSAPEGDSKNGDSRTRGKGSQIGAWTDLFLRAYRAGGDLSVARKAAGIGRTALYAHRDRDDDFAADLRDVEDEIVDQIANGSRKRAIAGVKRTKRVPVKRTTTKLDEDTEEVEIEYEEHEDREHSFAREKFWLERMRPEIYGEKTGGDLSAAEYAQRIHAALAAMEGSMDEDEPEGEG